MNKKPITEKDNEFWALSDEDREALRVGRVILEQWELREKIINRIEEIIDEVLDL